MYYPHSDAVSMYAGPATWTVFCLAFDVYYQLIFVIRLQSNMCNMELCCLNVVNVVSFHWKSSPMQTAFEKSHSLHLFQRSWFYQTKKDFFLSFFEFFFIFRVRLESCWNARVDCMHCDKCAKQISIRLNGYACAKTQWMTDAEKKKESLFKKKL